MTRFIQTIQKSITVVQESNCSLSVPLDRASQYLTKIYRGFFLNNIIGTGS